MPDLSKLPPFPWDWTASETPSGNGQFHAYVTDATGKKIMAVWGREGHRAALADFIRDACNEMGRGMKFVPPSDD